MTTPPKPDDPSARPKKPYAEPTMHLVALRPEEAVLGFCKNNTSGGPTGGGCRNVTACSAQGS